MLVQNGGILVNSLIRATNQTAPLVIDVSNLMIMLLMMMITMMIMRMMMIIMMMMMMMIIRD